jgi:hypothetical protein
MKTGLRGSDARRSNAARRSARSYVRKVSATNASSERAGKGHTISGSATALESRSRTAADLGAGAE